MLSDFIIMGALLLRTGIAIDFAVRKITRPLYRIISVTAIVLTLLLIWIELAFEGVS